MPETHAGIESPEGSLCNYSTQGTSTGVAARVARGGEGGEGGGVARVECSLCPSSATTSSTTSSTSSTITTTTTTSSTITTSTTTTTTRRLQKANDSLGRELTEQREASARRDEEMTERLKAQNHEWESQQQDTTNADHKVPR
ncbi:hypothetical protein CRUP_033148 [Coryphaenoides rupestris]|nr:hypothetical protein CRUP_033148 [Coryphaenoides rupestris]